MEAFDMTELVDTIVSRLDKEEQQKLTKCDIDILKKFDEHNKRNHNRPTTRDCQIRIMSAFARDIGKTFKQMTKKDVEGYFDRLTVKPYTIEHRRLVIVKFFKWLYDEDKPPKVVSGLKPNKEAYDKIINPSDLWHDEEVKQLVEACDNSRDKAFIMTLYDSGVRAGEILSMNVEDVHFEGDLCKIFVRESKTKKRGVPVLFCIPYLTNWLNNHPFKNKLNHPLWISFSARTYGQRLADSSTFDMMKTVKKRAGIEKKINHHIMRHSRISHCRKAGMKDHFVRYRHGYAPGSRVIERYTWFEEKDVDNDYREAMGYKPLEPLRQDPEILKPIKCLCGAENPCDAKFCHKCRLPLRYEEVEHSLGLLEMFGSNFAKTIELDKAFSEYKSVKAHTPLLQQFQQCFDGNTVLETEKIRQYFKGQLTNDQVLELLGVLMSYEILDIVADKVFLTDKEKLNELIEEHQNMLKVNS